jgi:hypothetical protein
MKMSRADRALLNAARRDLRSAPRVLGSGRADSLRSAPFGAKFPGVCARCRNRIALGDDIRFHTDYPDPVHVGCREATARAEPRPKSVRPKASPVCQHCWTEHVGECL